MKDNDLHRICTPTIPPLTPEEQKKMDKIFDAMFKEDDCHD